MLSWVKHMKEGDESRTGFNDRFRIACSENDLFETYRATRKALSKEALDILKVMLGEAI